MEEQLSKDDLSQIRIHLDSCKDLNRRMTPLLMIVIGLCLVVIVLAIVTDNLALLLGTTLAMGISTLIFWQIFYRRIGLIRKDLLLGSKVTEQLTVKKVKKHKNSRVAVMNNGLNISLDEFDQVTLDTSREYLVEYTPSDKFVLNISLR